MIGIQVAVAILVQLSLGTPVAAAAGGQGRVISPRATTPRAAAASGNAKAPVPITVSTTLSRTAVWIGEPIVYTIEVRCPIGTDILPADISQDRLHLTGLEIEGSKQQRSTRYDGTTVYRAQFTLASYSTDGSRVGVEGQSVRYYVHTAGQPLETLVPADEIQLPPQTIAIRSTLPDANIAWIRDARPGAQAPAVMAYLAPAGIALVTLTLIPVSLGLARTIRKRAPRHMPRLRRDTLRLHRETLRAIEAAAQTADADGRREVFERLDALIRIRLSELGLPGRSQTADELEQTMRARTKRLRAGEIGEVLRNCERALYGPSMSIPGAEAVQTALQETNDLLGQRA